MIPVDIDVWLDTERLARQVKVIPYVRTAEEMKVDYRIELVRGGATGSTRIAQSGAVTSSPAKPAAMGQMSVDTHPTNGKCHISISLRSRGESLGDYSFDCPT